MVRFQRVAERSVEMDLVLVVATDLVDREVPRVGQLVDDAKNGSFLDADEVGNVADSHIGLTGDADQNMGVVREKGPGLFVP
jgi:thiamine pyrophosphate-dependent acetolactate synthase large subunit-like protein